MSKDQGNLDFSVHDPFKHKSCKIKHNAFSAVRLVCVRYNRKALRSNIRRHCGDKLWGKIVFLHTFFCRMQNIYILFSCKLFALKTWENVKVL